MNKKTKKQLGMVAALVLLLAISGCGTMMFLFGDNLGYSISGKVQSSSTSDDKGLQNVTVAVDCSGLEASVYQNRKGVTDENGNYILTGYWELEGCKMNFTHDKYRTLTTDIDKSRLVKSEGLLLSYKLDIRLDPK
jgi:hypothetical protein